MGANLLDFGKNNVLYRLCWQPCSATENYQTQCSV